MWFVITVRRNRRQYFLHKMDGDGKPIWHSNVKQALVFRNPERVKEFIRHNNLKKVEIKGTL